ncbi:hypothetical protein [Streptomyces huasconensis]|uniref:hypothetical protein n=1 Tax=Streptomyces huasconensis TaxID=1854574 RepID=UPI003700BFC4
MEQSGGRLRIPVAAVITVCVLLLALTVWAVLWVKGAWRAVVRLAPELMVDWPGGPWAFGLVSGAAAGAVALAGGWLLAAAPQAEAPQTRRLVWRAGMAVCWGLPFLGTLYLFAALPGRRCRSYESACQALPGVGPALVTHLVTAVAVGWAAYRLHAAREQRRAAERQVRLRKLRKRGKGKSRRAAAR